MSFATKHNKGGVNWGIETKDFEYFSLKDLYEKDGEGKEYILKGCFINTKNSSEYGPSVVGILEDKMVNLPSHMEEEVKAILKDEEDINDIKAGKVAFVIQPYKSHGKECFGVGWVDRK